MLEGIHSIFYNTGVGEEMAELIQLPIKKKWEERIQSIRFGKRKLLYIDEYGDSREHVFITLENDRNKKFKVTGYTQYFLKKMKNREIETKDNHAKIIVSFLNYVFFEKYDRYKLKRITDLQIGHGEEFLQDMADGKIGDKKKTKETVQRAERILTKFYRFIFEQCDKKMKYITDSDFVEITTVSNKKRSRKTEKSYESLFDIEYRHSVPTQRIKSISSFLFSEIMAVCDSHYPQLKLAICLQAFGGLRKGEVCNVTKDKLKFGMSGFDIGWFNVDLREKTPMRSDGKSTGGIKKYRIQPIHPVFLSIFQKVYDEHMKLIANTPNKFGAIFLNRYGEAMMAQDYEKMFARLLKKVHKRLSKRKDFKSLSEANILMSGSMNTHVLRHFFTQFISLLEDTRNPTEIAYWRGDSSLETAIIYLTQHPQVDDKIKEIQQRVFQDIWGDIA